jgi:lipopolysaccharide export system ATP-binding protein
MSLVGKNLYKSFHNTFVVSDVSIHIERGEIVGLFGANGAGKTTCFLMIAGLINNTKGTVIIDDTVVTKAPLYQRSRLGLRYLPQKSSIFEKLSVENNLYAVAELFYPRTQSWSVVNRLLDEFCLTSIRDKKGHVLSGGQRRRVEIARTLIGHPSFILFDEPLAGIDPKSINDLAMLIKDLASRNIGILITDHNIKDMLPLVNRAYVMHNGKVIGQGTPTDVIRDPNVRTAYLGHHFPDHIDDLTESGKKTSTTLHPSNL